MRASSIFAGMAGQAFGVAFLWHTGLMVPSPIQQFIAGCLFLATGIFYSIIEKKV